MKIMIPTKIIKDQNITDRELALYSAICAVPRRANESVYVHADHIIYLLFESKDRNFRQAIPSMMEQLNNAGYIHYDTISPYEYVLDAADFKYESFIKVSQTDLFLITRTDMKGKYKLMRYYLALLSTVNWNTGEGGMPITYISKVAGVTEKSAYKYNEMLEDLNLIQVEKGSSAHSNNTYLLPFGT